MLSLPEKAYCRALAALKNEDYALAANEFEQAAEFFRENAEFNLLRETNRLLLTVREELAQSEAENLQKQEALSNGQETKLRR
ncbi:MAG: hypothetical protein ACE5FH_06130 [Candidatus Zixiibacteriota bacterium]